ncbi:uncharacterized transporter YycB [Arthrobacter sp. Hiyo8]|nr:uncharacterized transporter YycB [Arthrobacter sp. Hiyo8]
MASTHPTPHATEATTVPTSGGTVAPKSRVVAVVGIVAVILIGLNLRAGITSAAALFHDLQAFLGYGALVASILPSIPLLCFAVAGLGTSWLSRRIGVEKSILVALAMLAAGLLVRSIPATGALLAGTVLAMSGLAVCNVAMPSYIREHYASKTSMMTGLYTFTMSAGATFAAAVSVPWPNSWARPRWAWPHGDSLASPHFLASSRWSSTPIALHGRPARSTCRCGPSCAPGWDSSSLPSSRCRPSWRMP